MSDVAGCGSVQKWRPGTDNGGLSVFRTVLYRSAPFVQLRAAAPNDSAVVGARTCSSVALGH